MKKILFCIHNFAIGGVPRALLSLLPHLKKEEYEVTIFCPNQTGEFQGDFAKYQVLPQDKVLELFSMNLSKTPLSFKKSLAVCLKGIRRVLLRCNVDIYKKYLYSIGSFFSNKFDIVVAYSEGDITEMVSRISAKKKIAWIHIDYKRLQIYNHDKDESAIYAHFDKIVSPSSFSAQSFRDVYPQMADKIVSIPNLLDTDYIRKKAYTEESKDPRFETSAFTIVSVGRVCGEKRFYDIPEIASKISANFKWYIIGGGSMLEESELMNQITEFNIGDRVVFLGKKSNPYPYLAQSNLLVSLSFSETFSYSIFEAKVLGIPVVVTPFGSSEDIMTDEAGIIVEDNELSSTIDRLIKDKERYISLKKATEGFNYLPDCRPYYDLFAS